MAYVLLGAGSILLIGEIVEWGIMGKRLALMGSFVAIWFGVTYKEDAPAVRKAINDLLADGAYPAGLWRS
ncbi:MAG: hypothetical protein EBU73_08370 [Chitinophagia bacterium]|nr:hypothetical protein [Chitinophagia bacterium]